MPVRPTVILFFFLHLFLFSLAGRDSLVLENNSVARKFSFSKDSMGFFSKSFINKQTGENYVNPATEEFNVTINGVEVNGLNCRYRSHSFKQYHEIRSLNVLLETPVKNIFVELIYLEYENIALIRKQLNVINKSQEEITITDIDVEKLRFQVVDKYMNEVYSNYGSNLTRIPYKGDYNDAAVLLFNLDAKQGAVFGNEAPGILKNTEIYTQIHGCIQIGMRHLNEAFPFKKLMKPGETFRSPMTFIYVFQSGKWQDGFEGDYKSFVRKYLGISLFNRNNRPLSFYDTWVPFLDTLDEKLIRDCTNKLVSSGIDVFIIDAGWYKYSGDFIQDSSKFPDGLKPVCDYIRNKGLATGLWFTVSVVNAQSKIALQHPEWLIKDKNGKPANLHNMAVPENGPGWGKAINIMSLGSLYYDYIKDLIADYVKSMKLSYVKLDLSMVSSAYVHDPARTGDYESNSSKLYKDRSASYWIIYERMMQLMDELHVLFPSLLIDCTFETWGRYNVADYALVEHADYEWLTNFQSQSPIGPISIRQMNFDRSRVIPPCTLLLGNQPLDREDYQTIYFSLASASIVLVGDPRKLTSEQQRFYLKWNTYLKEIERKYQYSQYFQLYDIFDRPTDNNWDGCFRINTEKQSGLMFFFRNNSSDVERIFKVPCLHPEYQYKIYAHQLGKIIGIFSGKQLIEEGLKIRIPETYSSMVLTIEKI